MIVNFGPYVIEIDKQGRKKVLQTRPKLNDEKRWVKTKRGWERK